AHSALIELVTLSLHDALPISTMSMNDANQLSFFSQRHQPALAVPGQSIQSIVPSYAGGVASYSGTDIATGVMAGTGVLVAEALRSEEHTSELQSRANLVC